MSLDMKTQSRYSSHFHIGAPSSPFITQTKLIITTRWVRTKMSSALFSEVRYAEGCNGSFQCSAVLRKVRWRSCWPLNLLTSSFVIQGTSDHFRYISCRRLSFEVKPISFGRYHDVQLYMFVNAKRKPITFGRDHDVLCRSQVKPTTSHNCTTFFVTQSETDHFWQIKRMQFCHSKWNLMWFWREFTIHEPIIACCRVH